MCVCAAKQRLFAPRFKTNSGHSPPNGRRTFRVLCPLPKESNGTGLEEAGEEGVDAAEGLVEGGGVFATGFGEVGAAAAGTAD